MINKNKMISVVAAGILALSSAVSAPVQVGAASSYKPVAGGTVEFEKYLVYKNSANCPTAEFSFTIADGTAIAADKTASKSAVYAGNSDPSVSDTAPVIYNTANHSAGAKAVFDNTKAVYTTAQALDSTGNFGNHATLTNDPVDLTGNKAYSRDRVTVDFTGVTFSEPGVYRWVISEAAMTSAQQELGFTADPDATRVLDVYVRDKGTVDASSQKWELEIVGYVLHNNETYQPSDNATATEPDLSNASTKAIGYTNSFDTYNLSFSNQISGNQASRDKYFKYTVTIEEAGVGTKMYVDIANADGTVESNGATLDAYEGLTNPNSFETDATNQRYIVTDANATVTKDFYLQHGQSVTIKGLPVNSKYTIVEVAEDYDPSAEITGDTVSGKTGSNIIIPAESAGTSSTTLTVTDTDMTADTSIAFTNERLGTIPTGVLTSVLPGMVIIMISAAGFFILRKKGENA